MIRFKTLLAKSSSSPDSPEVAETLVGHTTAVIDAASALTDLLSSSLQTLIGLNSTDAALWKKAVLVAAWMHDWGKANDHFQLMLRKPSFKQGVRHESLSIIMAWELESWLRPLWANHPPWFKQAALFAACAHHLKFPDPIAGDRPGLKVKVFYDHPNLKTVMDVGSNLLELAQYEAPETKDYSLLKRGEVHSTLRQIRQDLTYEPTNNEKLLIASVKAGLISADLAGSALPQQVEEPVSWIAAKINKTLNQRQLDQVVSSKIQGKKLRPFQHELGGSDRHTILAEAGCGSGKTVGAYLWAANNADGKRLFFCYPTTTTASEGFAGYLWDPDLDAILIHSRSRIDYKLLSNMPLPRDEENDLREAGLEALETWPMPAVVCTTHTVLGIFEDVRRSLYAWPSLVQSVFVFDEVHAYSDRLFSYLLRFLQTFTGAKVLMMTATLQQGRRKAIEAVCEHRGGVQVIRGPQEREEAKRYKLTDLAGADPWAEVSEVLKSGGKVLWVCNTVRRAMERVGEALVRSVPVQPFHSRYRYCDRLNRQQAIIQGFRSDAPILAVTTQVAEMSLDLSSDLLVTEYAPVPALIQRLGRLNRFDECPRETKKALLLQPPATLPYSEEDWLGCKEWIAAVADGTPKSQRELAQAFLQISEAHGSTEDVQPVSYCEWIDGVWRSLKDQRAIEEASFTIEVIREEDRNGNPIEMAIPMPFPKSDAWRDWDRVHRFHIAPTGTLTYDDFKGAEWS